MKKAAVIGLGDISFIHLAAIQTNPQITLVAVCDIDAKKKNRLRRMCHSLQIIRK